MPSTGESLTDEQLDEAARLYFLENWSWTAVATQFLRCAYHTLLAARRSDRWPPIRDRYQVRIDDLRTKAYEALERKVREGDMNAVKEALARTEGPVAQKLEHSGPGGGEVVFRILNHADAAAAARGDSVPGAGDVPGE